MTNFKEFNLRRKMGYKAYSAALTKEIQSRLYADMRPKGIALNVHLMFRNGLPEGWK